jgi:hypothetical protein
MWLDIYPQPLARQPGVGVSYPNFQKQYDSSHSTSMAVIAVELDMTGHLTSTTHEKEQIKLARVRPQFLTLEGEEEEEVEVEVKEEEEAAAEEGKTGCCLRSICFEA